MDDDVDVISHHPLAAGDAVDGHRAQLVLRAEAVAEFRCDGLEVRLGVTGADHEKIREGGDATQVDDKDVVRLLLVGDACDGLG